MTDAELDEHFAHFDVYGIPRLKSDSDDVPPEPGTLRYAAQVAQRAALRSNNPQLARDARLIMDTHFPDRDAAAAPATADDAAAE